MGRPIGINAVMNVAAETNYGQTPAANFLKLPFVSHALGEEQPLIEDDQLGFGREGLDPVHDVITNDGDLVVPVDLRAFGFWLRMALGAPVTTGPTNGKYTHTFTSGGANLPSASIEIGSPDVPTFSVHYGAALNQLRIGMSRSGMLNATLGLICQGESDPVVNSVAGSPTSRTGPRFAQATGAVTIDGAASGDVVSADFTFSNQLDKVEVIRSDGRIGGVDPGPTMMTGTVVVRNITGPLVTKGRSKVAAALAFGWTHADGSLTFTVNRAFMPRVKRPITGPKGIQASLNWQASGASGAKLVVTLVNDVPSYA